MSHPDLIIAAKLAPEDPIMQLGRLCLRALHPSYHPGIAFSGEDFRDTLLEEATRLGLLEKRP